MVKQLTPRESWHETVGSELLRATRDLGLGVPDPQWLSASGSLAEPQRVRGNGFLITASVGPDVGMQLSIFAFRRQIDFYPGIIVADSVGAALRGAVSLDVSMERGSNTTFAPEELVGVVPDSRFIKEVLPVALGLVTLRTLTHPSKKYLEMTVPLHKAVGPANYKNSTIALNRVVPNIAGVASIGQAMATAQGLKGDEHEAFCLQVIKRTGQLRPALPARA